MRLTVVAEAVAQWMTNSWEARLSAFVDLDAAQFSGRKALMTAPRGRRLLGLTCMGAPAYRQPIRDGAKVAGHVTACVYPSYFGAGIGFAHMVEAGDWIGRHLPFAAADRTMMHCSITDLPFDDAERSIPRGLDGSVP